MNTIDQVVDECKKWLLESTITSKDSQLSFIMDCDKWFVFGFPYGDRVKLDDGRIMFYVNPFDVVEWDMIRKKVKGMTTWRPEKPLDEEDV
jgi:hypothetical protein